MSIAQKENLTAAHGTRVVDTLVDEFSEKLVVMLDRTSYFYAKDLWEFVSDKRSTECVDALRSNACVAHHSKSGCWNQLAEWFKYRLITDFGE